MKHEEAANTHRSNPFVFGRPLDPADHFFHRGHELAWLSITALKPKGTQPLAVVGPPGIGKTSLLKRAADEPGSKNLKIIIIDAPAIVQIENREFLWSLAQEMSRELREFGIQAPELQKRRLLLNALNEFNTHFWNPLDQSLQDLRVLLVLDRAEVFFDLAEGDELGSDILNIMTDLYLEASNIEYLYVLYEVEAKYRQTAQILGEDAKVLELRNFKLEEALNIIDGLHPYWAAKDVRKYIHDLTGGHPNDLQRLCHALYERCSQQGISHITMADVTAVLTMDPNPSDFYMPVYKRRNIYKYRFPPENPADIS